MNYQPEPCLKGRCYSPMACGGFGYCRERNLDGVPTETTAAQWRAEANAFKAQMFVRTSYYPLLAQEGADLRTFLNRLRIMISIDQSELHDVGLMRAGAAEWMDFRECPYQWLIRASDKDAAKVWSIIVRRETPKSG